MFNCVICLSEHENENRKNLELSCGCNPDICIECADKMIPCVYCRNQNDTSRNLDTFLSGSGLNITFNDIPNDFHSRAQVDDFLRQIYTDNIGMINAFFAEIKKLIKKVLKNLFIGTLKYCLICGSYVLIETLLLNSFNLSDSSRSLVKYGVMFKLTDFIFTGAIIPVLCYNWYLFSGRPLDSTQTFFSFIKKSVLGVFGINHLIVRSLCYFF